MSEWLDLLRRHFLVVRTFAHHAPPNVDLDFASPYPSAISASDFVFVERSDEEFLRELTLTALYLASSPRPA